MKWSLALPDLASSAPHMLHDNVDISFTSSVTVLLPPPSAVVFSAALLLVLRPLAAALEPVMPTLVAVAKSCSRGGASGGGALSRNIFLYSPQLVSLWARLKKIFYRWRMRRYSILITVLRPKFSNAAKSGTLAPQEKPPKPDFRRADIRRISGGYPADTRRISAGYPGSGGVLRMDFP